MKSGKSPDIKKARKWAIQKFAGGKQTNLTVLLNLDFYIESLVLFI